MLHRYKNIHLLTHAFKLKYMFYSASVHIHTHDRMYTSFFTFARSRDSNLDLCYKRRCCRATASTAQMLNVARLCLDLLVDLFLDFEELEKNQFSEINHSLENPFKYFLLVLGRALLETYPRLLCQTNSAVGTG